MVEISIETAGSAAEHRKEERFPCLKMPLFYSPASHSLDDGVRDKIYKAAVIDMSLFGLAFDVDQPREVGAGIILLVEKDGSKEKQELLAEVRWCREVGEGIFRIGLSIDANSNYQKPTAIELASKSTTPMEVDAKCPACDKRSTFHFIAYQPIMAESGVMPLFNCSICGTTRSLTGVLNQE